MRLFLFTLCLFSFKPFWAQNFNGNSFIRTQAYEERSKKQNVLVKARFAPLPLGNSLYLITSASIDYRFFRNHSLGISVYRSHEGYQEEEYKDTTGTTQYSVNIGENLHKSIVGSYRCYFNYKDFNYSDFHIFYAGLFYRYGQILDQNFPLFSKNTIVNKETNYSKGILIGMFSDFSNHFGYDVNVGVYNRQSHLTSISQNGDINTSENKNSWGVRVDFGLTFFL